MRVLVTGADGFIGSHVVPALSFAEVVPFAGDVRSPRDWSRYRDIDVIVHLAARVGTGESMYRTAEYVDVNVLGTARMLEACTAMGVRRIVLASSSAVYGGGILLREQELPVPSSTYGVSKLAQEHLVRTWAPPHGIGWTALRLFCVYGGGQSLANPYSGLVAMMAARLLAGRAPLLFEDGHQSRDLVHVSDVGRAFASAAQGALPGVVNIGTGIATTVLELVGRLREDLGGPAPEMVGRHRAGDVRNAIADVSRATSLGWRAEVPVREGLRSFCEWAVRQDADPALQERAVAELIEQGLAR